MLALNQTSPSLYSGQSSRPPRGRLGTIQQCGRLLLPTLVEALKATNIDICCTHFLSNCILKSRALYQISIIQVFFSALRLRLKGIRLVESAPAGLKGAESCFWLEAFSIQDKTEYAQRQTTWYIMIGLRDRKSKSISSLEANYVLDKTPSYRSLSLLMLILIIIFII